MKKLRIFAITPRQMAEIDKARKAKITEYAEKKGISFKQAEEELKSPPISLKKKSKKKSKSNKTKSSSSSLISSAYLSKSKSVWPYR